MYRLSYLIPRIVLLVLAFLAAAIAGDTIAEGLVTAHLESSTGLDVEIGRLRTRTANGKIFVNDLALVDPMHPLSNLFQADLAFFEVDLSAIFKRQLVIDKARASQVRLAVPRTSLVSNPTSTEKVSSDEFPLDLVADTQLSSAGRFVSNNDEVRLAWLDQFESNRRATVVNVAPTDTNQLYQLASATNEKWNKGLQQQNGKLKLVSATFSKVTDGTLSPEELERNGLNGPPNPLRRQRDNRHQQHELEEILKTLEQLQRQQVQLERQATADMATLDSTYQQELASHDPIEAPPLLISGENLSQLLLTDLHQRIANEAMAWFTGVRAKVLECSGIPSKGVEPQGVSSSSRWRGELIEIPGAALQRPTMIKQLTFDGAGRFNQRHVNFAGEAFDLSDQPAMQDLPVTFKLRAQGDQHFALQGSIDRRSGVCSDALTVDFPAFHLGTQSLGTENEILITTGPRTTAHGTIELKIDGQNVSGSMRLDITGVALVVDHLHRVAGGREVALRLNQSLATLQQFQSTATIGGTLANPQLSFESNLGETVALAMSQINQSSNDDANDQVATNEQVNEFYKTQVLALKTSIKTELDSINRAIDSQIGIAQRMQTSLRTAKSRWPEIR